MRHAELVTNRGPSLAPNESLQRIAARLCIGMKPKGRVWAARGARGR